MSLSSAVAFFDACRAGIMGPTLLPVGVRSREITLSGSIVRQSSAGSCNRNLQGMPVPHPHINCGGGNAKNSARRPNTWVGKSINRDWNESGLVFGCLLPLSRPSAIFRRIVLGWINAVNGVVETWSFSHIGQKIYERLIPSFADLNALRTISGKVLKLRICASALHAHPYAVGRRPFSANFVAVLQSAIRVSHVNCILAPVEKVKP